MRWYKHTNRGTRRRFLFRAVFAVLCIGLNASVSCIADPIPQLVTQTKPATVQILALNGNWLPITIRNGIFDFLGWTYRYQLSCYQGSRAFSGADL